MALGRLRANWDRLAAADPLEAVLTGAGCGDFESFFATGDAEIRHVLHFAASIGFPAARRQALDFGCGAGRLTQALAEHFDWVHGVDVSPVMIRLARLHNRHPERCRYTVNHEPHLRLFADREFDFIYSNITLQHLPPRLTRAYLAEFLRLLAPGGLLIFLLPARRLAPLRGRLPFNLYQHWIRLTWPLLNRRRPLMEMYAIPRRAVVRHLQRHGGRLLDLTRLDTAGPDWECYRYAVAHASA